VLASSRTLRAGCRRCRFAASWTTLARGALRGQVGQRDVDHSRTKGWAVAKTPQPVACHGRVEHLSPLEQDASDPEKPVSDAAQRPTVGVPARSQGVVADAAFRVVLHGPREPNGIRPDAVASERHSA